VVGVVLLLVLLRPLVALVAVAVLVTAIVAFVKNSRTWLRFGSRPAAAVAGTAAVATLLAVFAVNAAVSPTPPPTAVQSLVDETAAPPPEAPTPIVSATPTPTVLVREETVVEAVDFAREIVEDPAVDLGEKVVTVQGVPGERTLVYQVTMTDGVESGRELVSDEMTTVPVDEVTVVGIYEPPPVEPASDCDSNYADGCVPIASDVDCAWGTGNGPAYFDGVARVVGADVYDLDRDGDGYACEQ
jgi:hypothetical protein